MCKIDRYVKIAYCELAWTSFPLLGIFMELQTPLQILGITNLNLTFLAFAP